MSVLFGKLRHIRQRREVFSNWLSVVFPFNRFSGASGKLMKLRNGKSVFIRNIFGSDFHTTLAVVGRDDYGLKQMSLPASATIVDVGGNIGTFSLTAAAIFPESSIHTFEPEKANYKALSDNIQRNNQKNVHTHNCAIGPNEGKMSLHVNAESTGSHSVLEGHTTNTNTQEITVTTLEKFVTENNISTIDLLKMDIEGAEYDIFYNMPKQVLSMVKRITLEIHKHPVHSSEDLQSFFRDEGFTVRPSDTSKRVFICER